MNNDVKKGLILNDSGNARASEENVIMIMNKIIANEISNVRYFVSKELGMQMNKFNQKLKDIQIKYPKFYDYYNNVVQANVSKKKEELKDIIYYIDTLMKYGIELEDGSFRLFDEIDWLVIKNKYFDNLLRTEISAIFDELIKDSSLVLDNINLYNVRLMVSRTYENNATCSTLYQVEIPKTTILNNLDKLTQEEAEFLFKFFEDNKIPFNLYNYEYCVQKLIMQRNTKNNLFDIEIPSLTTNRGKG